MGTHCHCRDTHLPSIIMAREIRMRVSEQEYSLLETVRDTSEKYDGVPLGYVVGELARQELAEQFSEDSNDREEPEVNF